MPVFEAALLPDPIKEALCQDLLAEFGITRVIRRNDELIHGCPLPWGNHSNQATDPTASLNWKKLTFKCLGCGSGGGLLWFISSCRPGTSAAEARKWLESSQGLGNSQMPLQALLDYLDAIYAQRPDHYEPIPVYSERVLRPWEWMHPYMTEIRGVPEATLEKFRVGYAARYQISKEPPVFSERIVIPHFWGDDLVGWQTRRLGADGTPKYLSSPNFPREQTIYNYDSMAEMAVVVESPLSVLRHDHHVHMEATFGASITERQVKLLQRHRKVVIWLDNDKAGWDALHDTIDRRGKVTKQGLISALVPFCQVYLVHNPWAADPADLPDDVVDDLIANAVPWPVWSQPLPGTLKEWSTA